MFESALRNAAKLLVALVAIPMLCAQAQSNDPQNESNTGAAATGAPSAEDRALVEEVIVIGTRPISSIRKEIFAAEDILYNRFNELNDEDAFDIICTKEAPIGSQIRRRVCRSRFMVEAENEAALDLLDNYDGNVSLSRRRLVVKHQREIMADLANKNPDFLQLLKKRWALRQVYEQRVKACGWNLKCLN